MFRDISFYIVNILIAIDKINKKSKTKPHRYNKWSKERFLF